MTAKYECIDQVNFDSVHDPCFNQDFNQTISKKKKYDLCRDLAKNVTNIKKGADFCKFSYPYDD